MKTKILSVLRLPSGYLNDLKVYDSLETEQIELLGELFQKIEPNSGAPIGERAIAEHVSEINISGDQFNNFLSTIYFARYVLSKFGDSVDDFVSDLKESGHIDNKIAQKYLLSLNKIQKADLILQSVDDDFSGVLPILRETSIKSIILPQFSEDIADYDKNKGESPSVMRIEPAAVVNIGVVGPGITQDFSFVVSKQRLNTLIKELLIVQDHLEVLKERFED